ncbi:NnrS family protein [Moraxella sp. ZJ142]|uniref:NnrS family protein n=1 Tax=Moraxella marmotae TaxID=3344520 RepID=UPI0035D45C52
MLINIAKPDKSPHPVLNLGFRVFFLSSAAFAVITMLAWHLVLMGRINFHLMTIPNYWHGHEMLFGYACAVIAGFLLTAVKAWTGVPMPVGWRLFAIFLPWLVARVLWLVAPMASGGAVLLVLAWVADVLFWLLTTFAVTRAVLIVRQKRQIGIVAKLILLLICQLAFGVGVLMGCQTVQQLSLYVALFLIVGVVFTIGRRVLPFFIEKGISVNNDGTPSGVQVKLANSALLDKASLFGFFGLMVVYLAYPKPILVSLLAVLVALVNVVRLVYWYHRGIWQKPLLWSLYLSFWGMVLSLLLIAILPWIDANPSLGVHSLALTAIGMTTVAMMARVSLGHTGRNIHQPPKLVSVMFVLMIASFVLRVLAPLFFDNYLGLIAASQGCWIVCFVLFLVAYTRILLSPRVDGLMG